LGQKTNPIGLRLGIVKTWDSRWFAKKGYDDLLNEDLFIRKYLKSRLSHAGVSRVLVQRASDKLTVTLHTPNPGKVIGRRGVLADQLRDELKHLTKKNVFLKISEIREPDLDATLVAESIARQLEQRVSFRRAMKKTIMSSVRAGAEGIRVECKGRLGGAEMARKEGYREGRVPLHTLRANIDYGTATARTTYGCVGVKVWIFTGEVFGKVEEPEGSATE
jgi:small subunit ribosomal protein S3